MAKNDNLTDFLKGLADKFRVLLGTSDPINPQDFEDKIQGVYDNGFAEGGPTGITATAPDVLSGKVFGSGGSAKATGTMANIGAVTRPTKYDANDGAHLYAWTPAGYHSSYDTSGHLVEQGFSDVAKAVGLTATKLVPGQTVLGITGNGGTGGKIVAVYAMCAGGWTGATTSTNASKTNIDTSIFSGTSVKKSGRYQITRIDGPNTDNWITWPSLNLGVGTHTLSAGSTISVSNYGKAKNGYMPIAIFLVAYLGS